MVFINKPFFSYFVKMYSHLAKILKIDKIISQEFKNKTLAKFLPFKLECVESGVVNMLPLYNIIISPVP